MLISLSVSSQTITRDSAVKVIPHAIILELDSVPLVMVNNDLIYIHEDGKYQVISTKDKPDEKIYDTMMNLSYILILGPLIIMLIAILIS